MVKLVPAGMANGWVAAPSGTAAQQVGFLASSLIETLLNYCAFENPTVGNACWLWQQWEKHLRLVEDNICSSEIVRIAKGFSARLSGFVVSGGVHHLKQMVESHGPKVAIDMIMKDLPEPLPKELASALGSFRVAASWTEEGMPVDNLSRPSPQALQQCLPFLTRYYGLDHKFLRAMLPEKMDMGTDYVKTVEEALMCFLSCARSSAAPRPWSWPP